MGGAGAGGLAVFPLGVGLLDVGGVQEHDVHEVRRQARREDLAVEALLDEHGHPAGVVDVGVGDEDIVDAPRREGELLIADLVPALLQTAVHQDLLAVDLQTVAAAGDALVGAEKAQFHTAPPCILIMMVVRSPPGAGMVPSVALGILFSIP